jgi:2-dehydro-3-deoxyphosphogluconate aldolase/(4S)-4-hydroxy-2-oxoglutarate aldolase
LAGAGTVLAPDQVDSAVDAGAQFIVSPGFNPKVVAHCSKKGILVIPGCANPSDIEQAIEFNLDVVKFFPAEAAGGLEYIKAISAPYPQLKFMPTGGINVHNIAQYIAFDKVLACGGSWMADAGLINAGDFAKITALSQEAVLSLLGLTVTRIDGGHIAVTTNSIARAIPYLEGQGIVFDHAGAKKDSNGKIVEIYLKEKIFGFTVCLLQIKK